MFPRDLQGSNDEAGWPNMDGLPGENTQWPEWKRDCVFAGNLRKLGFAPLADDWNTWKRTQDGIVAYITLPNHPVQPVVVSLKYADYRIGASSMTMDSELWGRLRVGANNRVLMDALVA